MSVYQQDALDVLIASIATAMNGTSLNSNNTIAVSYKCIRGDDLLSDEWPVV